MKKVAIGLILLMFASSLFAAGENVPKGLKGVSIGGVWYLSYQAGKMGGENFNYYKVKRGYINIKKRITPWFSGRITPDVHQETSGDLKVRLKYAYAQFNLPNFGIFYKPIVEWGLVHMPWLDFEEHVNYYRLQDTMFMERNGLFNSADLGVTFVALLGGEMDRDYQDRVNNQYPGRYGSVSFGIYNGGGYHALENNTNKVPELRVTLRPLPDVVPGLQLSYFGLFGKGNTQAEPDWRVNAWFFSMETERFVLTGTLYSGKGTQKGEVNELGKSRSKSGYSIFGEWKIPQPRLSLIGRFDSFDPDNNQQEDAKSRIILGLAYHLSGHNTLLFDYDVVSYENSTIDSDRRFQTTVEVHF